MKIEKWTRSRLNRFLPVLRQLQGEDFQNELTELFEKSSSVKVIKFLEEIIPKGFIEDIFPKIYKDESINIVIQFADINLEFVIQKIILSSDSVIVNTYFSKLGHNPGKIELDEFLGLFFLPIVTDWSPTEPDSEGEFVRLLKKLNNIELRKKLESFRVFESKFMSGFIKDQFNLNGYSNYNFKFETILLEDNIFKNGEDDELIVKLTCYSKEGILLFTTPFYFKKNDKSGGFFKFVRIEEMINCDSILRFTEENFVETFLKTATYWYRFG